MTRLPCVLVVDDDEFHRYLARHELERLAGVPTLHVEEAAGGREALEKLARVVPAGPVLVLSDHRMPEMTGLDLLRAVRSAYPRTAVRFVIFTSTEQLADQTESHLSGVDQFLVKPIPLDEFRQMLQRLVSEWLHDLAAGGPGFHAGGTKPGSSRGTSAPS